MKKIKKWEYHMLYNFSTVNLDKMGKEGWELVSVTRSPQSRDFNVAYFKKELNNGQN